MYRLLAFILSLMAFLFASPYGASAENGNNETNTNISRPDYGMAFWPNGFRKEKADKSANELAFETGYYGFVLDLADFGKTRFGEIDGPGYLSATKPESKLMTNLASVPLKIEVEHQGKVYQAVNCLAGREKNPGQTILLESGHLAQHYRLPGLLFQDASSSMTQVSASMEMVAWPSSLTFSLSLEPEIEYQAGPCPGVVQAGMALRGKSIDVPHRAELDPEVFTLELWSKIPKNMESLNKRTLLIGKNLTQSSRGSNFGLMLRGETVSAVMSIGSGRGNRYEVSKGNGFSYGPWHHLVMSYDGNALRLFVDGEPAGEKIIGKARVSSDGALQIGGKTDARGTAANALFDELRMWNRVLTPDEIKAHAKEPAKYEHNGLIWEMNFNNEAADKAVVEPALSGAIIRMAFGKWKMEQQVTDQWKSGDIRDFILHCPVKDESWVQAPLTLDATGFKGEKFETRLVPRTAAYVIDIPKFERDWAGGMTDIRQYDEVNLNIKNASATRQYVPVLFDIKDPANITGQVPILCDADGKPTGIPIQLSKNWHYGAYSKFYGIIPVAPGDTHYRLRIAFGFWGTLPSASHAQLSLLGYGGNGRWDQLAIGCWGETICFDMDNSLTNMMVTDVRMLFTRNGPDGQKWNWSEGGWGGDWISMKRDGEDKLMPTDLKNAYLSQGPCLTDVRYNGYYGMNRDIAFGARLATLRTDDYNRIFQYLNYRFEKPLATTNSYLFKMGPTGGLLTPVIAYGNRKGLIAEHQVPGGLEANAVFKKDILLEGSGPWWIAFPGSFHLPGANWGTGSRGLVIRSFKIVHDGKEFRNPIISFPVLFNDKERNLSGLNMEVVPPAEIKQFNPGDTIETNMEWITLPRVADDYYGPNKEFLAHLQQNPKSWKTVYREAIGNDLSVDVDGGELTQQYPVVIQATNPEVEVKIKGGVGVVPIRFEGLKSAQGYKLYQVQGRKRIPLDQSVNGNDFWQTDYDAENGTYKMTFNLPLDGLKKSRWVLAK